MVGVWTPHAHLGELEHSIERLQMTARLHARADDGQFSRIVSRQEARGPKDPAYAPTAHR
jgi:hypothetical protein